MATRGFEFAYMLDGSNATPVIRDFTLGSATDHKVGDIMQMQSDGYIDPATASIDEITCVIQESASSGAVTAGTTKVKAAIVTRNQVWRCSMDASTTTAVVGNTKTIDVADANTIDADDLSSGSLCLVETGGTDSDGNVIAYVNFLDTTWGNA